MLFSGHELNQSDIESALIYTYKYQKKALSDQSVKGFEKKALEQFTNAIENTALLIKTNQLSDFKEVYNYEL